MSNAPETTHSPGITTRDFSTFLGDHRSTIQSIWEDQIRSMPGLQIREDLTSSPFPEHLLAAFFTLIHSQVSNPGTYQQLRVQIRSGILNAFTPDAACRLLLALKRPCMGFWTPFSLTIQIGQNSFVSSRQISWMNSCCASPPSTTKCATRLFNSRSR